MQTPILAVATSTRDQRPSRHMRLCRARQDGCPGGVSPSCTRPTAAQCTWRRRRALHETMPAQSMRTTTARRRLSRARTSSRFRACCLRFKMLCAPIPRQAASSCSAIASCSGLSLLHLVCFCMCVFVCICVYLCVCRYVLCVSVCVLVRTVLCCVSGCLSECLSVVRPFLTLCFSLHSTTALVCPWCDARSHSIYELVLHLSSDHSRFLVSFDVSRQNTN